MKPRSVTNVFALLILLALATSVFASGKANKLAVPSDAAQAEAMKTVKELFGEQWKKADDINAKRGLARSVLETAERTHGDEAGRYVLLKVAKEVATMALDGLTAFRAVDLMAEDYQVDPVVMKADVLKRGAPAATLNDHHKALAVVALKQVEDAIAEDNYEVAGQLCEFAEAQARAAGDVPNVEKASTLRGGVDRFAQLYDRAQTALPKLKADPVNPEANRAVGEYLAFVKMQWDEAVLMLALGSDPSLRGMAEKELQVLTADQQSDLADAWWDMAERESGLSQQRIRGHALNWYRKLLPQLTGLSRAKIEKRLARAEPAEDPSGGPQPAATVTPEPSETPRPSATTRVQNNSGTLNVEILNAKFGDGSRTRNVTAVLRKYVRNSAVIAMPFSTYREAFGDPAPNHPKHLAIQYRINGREGQVTLKENAPIVLPTPH